jgi:hypothetical protein
MTEAIDGSCYVLTELLPPAAGVFMCINNIVTYTPGAIEM